MSSCRNSETSSVRPLQWDLSGTSSVGLSSVTLPGGWCCNSVGCPWWDLLGGTSLVGPPQWDPARVTLPYGGWCSLLIGSLRASSPLRVLVSTIQSRRGTSALHRAGKHDSFVAME
ncbi:hypothetical protein O3P69_012633 [Scylla paramamosain]|uniref:Uncharacterized protein n=1 Tax=Scylla paramamosain TaxID=85552 RepID=A0AAW0SI19_SCYPA